MKILLGLIPLLAMVVLFSGVESALGYGVGDVQLNFDESNQALQIGINYPTSTDCLVGIGIYPDNLPEKFTGNDSYVPNVYPLNNFYMGDIVDKDGVTHKAQIVHCTNQLVTIPLDIFNDQESFHFEGIVIGSIWNFTSSSDIILSQHTFSFKYSEIPYASDFNWCPTGDRNLLIGPNTNEHRPNPDSSLCTPIVIESMNVIVEQGQEIPGVGKAITIKVSGASGTVEFKIIAPDGEIIETLSFVASNQGDVNLPWIIPKDIESGIYTVRATDAFGSAQTTFEHICETCTEQEVATLKVIARTIGGDDVAIGFHLNDGTGVFFVDVENNVGSKTFALERDNFQYILQQDNPPAPDYEFTSFDCTVNGEPVNYHSSTQTRAKFWANDNEQFVCTYLNTSTITEDPPSNSLQEKYDKLLAEYEELEQKYNHLKSIFDDLKRLFSQVV